MQDKTLDNRNLLDKAIKEMNNQISVGDGEFPDDVASAIKLLVQKEPLTLTELSEAQSRELYYYFKNFKKDDNLAKTFLNLYTEQREQKMGSQLNEMFGPTGFFSSSAKSKNDKQAEIESPLKTSGKRCIIS